MYFFEFLGFVGATQGVTKRCPLSWLTNSALGYEPKCGGRGGVAPPPHGRGSNPRATTYLAVASMLTISLNNALRSYGTTFRLKGEYISLNVADSKLEMTRTRAI